ncbi:MAG: GDP-mannose 4,6-dehydratase [Nanoarchaeota archaeon]|nr:GDP-mannose 4,6-dehydratase [Nanoarchaeota archaeon]
MKILVTGGSGFIGSHVVDKLLEAGHNIAVVDDLSNGRPENLEHIKDKITIHKVSIRSEELDSVFEKEKPEVVYHLAAHIDVRKSVEDPEYDANINVLGSINMMQCAKKHGVKKIIYSSTGGAIYGDTKNIPSPETESPDAICPYGVSKYCVERYLYLYKYLHKIDYTVLRYANVYGPRQDPLGEAGVVAIFIGNTLQGKDCRINGDGKQTRDYVFVGDVARANLMALTAKTEHNIFNIATGKETDVNELFSSISTQVEKLSGKKTKSFHAQAIPGEVLRSCLDVTRAKQDLGWTPQVSIQEGIKKTAEFFMEQQKK